MHFEIRCSCLAVHSAPRLLGGNVENVWKNTELCPWNVETADTSNYDYNEQGHQWRGQRYFVKFTVFGEGMFSKLITNWFKQGEHDVNILRNSVYS